MTQQVILTNILFVVMLLVIIVLLVSNIVHGNRAAKKEKDLLNRLMARSLDDYSVNTVRLAPGKPEHLGNITPSEETEKDFVHVD